jgi:hypothetical protein
MLNAIVRHDSRLSEGMDDRWGEKRRLQRTHNLAFDLDVDKTEKSCDIIMFAIRTVAWAREREQRLDQALDEAVKLSRGQGLLPWKRPDC